MSSRAARQAMIESQLKPCGVVDPQIVAAFYAVAREAFVDPVRAGLAYVDAEQALGNGRALLPPLSLGLLITDAAPHADDRVLIVGAATGYSAALLASLAGSVIALEAHPSLLQRAHANLAELANVQLVEGPLEAGWPDAAPYTLILIDGAIEALPATIVAQLADGGRLVTLLRGADHVTRAARGSKQAGLLRLEPFAEASGPILTSFRKALAFQF